MRPFVHINVAMREDGCMGEDGKPLDISCAEDWRRVHGLRERYQGVAVGSRTWVGEKPRLTAREDVLGRQPTRQPARVIFAGRGRCAVAPSSSRPTYVVGRQCPANGVVHVLAEDRRVEAALSRLYAHGVRSLLVEGGATLIRSFIAERAFDCFTAYVATADPAAARRAIGVNFSNLPELRHQTLGEGLLLGFGEPGRPGGE